jgi:hypothetical protein
VCDFPFATPSDKSAWTAFVLTLLSRHSFEGPTPLTLFEANTPGSGKTLLFEMAALLVFGREHGAKPYSEKDEELRKVITTVLRAGNPLVCFDNVTGMFGGSALDQVLTSTVWSDRLLGGNEEAEFQQYTVWAATANNAALVGDIHRRCVRCRLESPLESPEERTGFKHPYIKAHILENRNELLSAAFTVLRGYFAAGKPRQKLPHFGKFEAWSETVREAVVWAGGADPLSTREKHKNQPGSAIASLAAVLEGLMPLGVTTAERIIKRCAEENGASLKEGLVNMGVRLDVPRSLGRHLRSITGRVLNGVCLHTKQGAGRLTLFWVACPEQTE